MSINSGLSDLFFNHGEVERVLSAWSTGDLSDLAADVALYELAFDVLKAAGYDPDGDMCRALVDDCWRRL